MRNNNSYNLYTVTIGTQNKPSNKNTKDATLKNKKRKVNPFIIVMAGVRGAMY
jgi:hypothetical protein